MWAGAGRSVRVRGGSGKIYKIPVGAGRVYILRVRGGSGQKFQPAQDSTAHSSRL